MEKSDERISTGPERQIIDYLKLATILYPSRHIFRDKSGQVGMVTEVYRGEDGEPTISFYHGKSPSCLEKTTMHLAEFGEFFPDVIFENQPVVNSLDEAGIVKAISNELKKPKQSNLVNGISFAEEGGREESLGVDDLASAAQ